MMPRKIGQVRTQRLQPVAKPKEVRRRVTGLKSKALLTAAMIGASALASHAQESNRVVRAPDGHQVGIIIAPRKASSSEVPTNSAALYKSVGEKYSGWVSVAGFIGEKKVTFPMDVATKRAFLSLINVGLSESEIRSKFRKELNKQLTLCEAAAMSAAKHGITLEEALDIIEGGYWQYRPAPEKK